MRIATWNVNSVGARLPRLLEWLQSAQPDVLCLQELKTADFPLDAVAELGYEVATHSTGRWSGVGVVSRVGIADVRPGLADEPGYRPEDSMFEATEPRSVGVTCGGVRFWSIYAPNGREVGHPHYSYKLAWFDALRSTLQDELGDHPVLVTMGDFNVVPTDADVWDASALHGATHVTPPERAALAALRDLGLTDVVPRALKYDTPYTYWDYRGGAFHKNEGMRIDLVYASAPVAGAVTDAWIDRDARKGKLPSDHAPVVVDLDLPA